MSRCLAETLQALRDMKQRSRSAVDACMQRSHGALGASIAALDRWPRVLHQPHRPALPPAVTMTVSSPLPLPLPLALPWRMTDPQWIVCCATELDFVAPGLATAEAWRLASGACGLARGREPEHVAAALALGLASVSLH